MITKCRGMQGGVILLEVISKRAFSFSSTLPQSLRRAKTLSPFGLAALTLSGKGKRFTDLS